MFMTVICGRPFIPSGEAGRVAIQQREAEQHASPPFFFFPLFLFLHLFFFRQMLYDVYGHLLRHGREAESK